MDDRELEARLRARLHRRFDGAEPPATLHPVLADVAGSNVRVMPRSVPMAWLAAATLVIAVVAGLGLQGWIGPGGSGPTGTPEPTASPEATSRQYIVLPPLGSVPTKAETDVALDVFSARLGGIGVGSFTGSGGDGIIFTLPTVRDPAAILSVLATPGEVRIAPLPAAEYGSIDPESLVGKPLPTAVPALIEADGITGARRSSDASGQTLELDFTAAASDAVAAYTTDHVGEALAVLWDGEVVLVPRILGPISGGSLVISGGTDNSRLDLIYALVTGGRLPDSWRSPRVPLVMPASEARALAIAAAASPDAVAVRTELSTFGDPRAGEEVVAAWLVDLTGTLPDAGCTTSPFQTPLPPPCPVVSTGHVVIDAVTGEVLEASF